MLAAASLTALVVLAASAPRPALRGDGVLGLQVPPAVAGVGLVLGAAAFVVVLSQLRRARGSRDPLTARKILRAVVAVALLAWLLPRLLPPPDAGEGGAAATPPVPAATTQDRAPLDTSTTAVVASLIALGIVAAVGLRRGATTRRPGQARPARRPDPPRRSPVDPHTIADPRDAVIAAYAAGRQAVSELVEVRDSDGPETLRRRVDATAAGPAFTELTRLYLPVRFGRSAVGDARRERSLAALDAVTAAVHRSVREPAP